MLSWPLSLTAANYVSTRFACRCSGEAGDFNAGTWATDLGGRLGGRLTWVGKILCGRLGGRIGEIYMGGCVDEDFR